MTVRVKQKKEPAGTVTSPPGENEEVVSPEPTASVAADWAIVVGEEHVDEALYAKATLTPVVPPAAPAVQYWNVNDVVASIVCAAEVDVVVAQVLLVPTGARSNVAGTRPVGDVASMVNA
ncbi:MAG TPA: hypothetical protein VGS60_01145, partial [Actinomycetes bacterium]|nr:hypothetical protein [Actinomycetes bacterium]